MDRVMGMWFPYPYPYPLTLSPFPLFPTIYV